MTKPGRVTAVDDDALGDFLSELGIASAIDRGEMRCQFCENALTRDNLAAVFPYGGHVAGVCAQPDCIRQLMRYRDESRNA